MGAHGTGRGAENSMSMKEVFDNLYKVNINEYTEKKKSGNTMLTYLSWSYAWAEVMKRYPEAIYTIEKNEDGLPYFYDPMTGYMVFTKVTIHGSTHEMWLPVMDSNNAAMKSEPYEVKTKFRQYTVQAATMFDINKAIMRCLAKNLAMFGLGLYLYSGEDLPEGESEQEKPERVKKESQKNPDPVLASDEQIRIIRSEIDRTGWNEAALLKWKHIASIDQLKADDATDIIARLCQKKTKERD